MIKRGVFLVLAFAVFFAFFIANANALESGVTGKATSSSLSLNVSVQVVVSLASLTIIGPQNYTYITNDSLLLNFTKANASYVWYNIDNGQNTTLSNNYTYFNTTIGGHTLFLHANNTDGNVTSRNISFAINTTRFIINFSEYQGPNEHDSTDFDLFAFEELDNMSNIILEDISKGMMQFYLVINLTAINSSILNINSHTNISFNRVELNASAISIFNVSATIKIYNLTFSDPRILKDGAVCSSNICTEESYSSGTFTFNVTGFSVYSAEETPGGGGSGSSGGGGGGRSGGEISKTITQEKTSALIDINPDKIIISFKIGETQTKELILKNVEQKRITLNLEINNLDNIAELREESITLEAGESKHILIDFIAREDQIPDTYIGKIVIKGDEIEEEILVLVDISSKKSLFDVSVNIPIKYQSIEPGDELVANINLFSLGRDGKVDVIIRYFIKNDEDEIILSDEETVAVETQLDLLKLIKIPDYLEEGDYVLYVKVLYEGEVAVSSTTFFVKKTEIKTESIILYVLIGLVAVITMIIFYHLKNTRKHPKFNWKINETILARTGFLKVR